MVMQERYRQGEADCGIERRQYAPGAALIKCLPAASQRPSARDRQHETKAGNDNKDVHPQVSVFEPVGQKPGDTRPCRRMRVKVPHMADNDDKSGDRSQTVNVSEMKTSLLRVWSGRSCQIHGS